MKRSMTEIKFKIMLDKLQRIAAELGADADRCQGYRPTFAHELGELSIQLGRLEAKQRGHETALCEVATPEALHA